jgi:hypothetical protein
MEEVKLSRGCEDQRGVYLVHVPRAREGFSYIYVSVSTEWGELNLKLPLSPFPSTTQSQESIEAGSWVNTS